MSEGGVASSTASFLKASVRLREARYATRVLLERGCAGAGAAGGTRGVEEPPDPARARGTARTSLAQVPAGAADGDVHCPRPAGTAAQVSPFSTFW